MEGMKLPERDCVSSSLSCAEEDTRSHGSGLAVSPRAKPDRMEPDLCAGKLIKGLSEAVTGSMRRESTCKVLQNHD